MTFTKDSSVEIIPCCKIQYTTLKTENRYTSYKCAKVKCAKNDCIEQVTWCVCVNVCQCARVFMLVRNKILKM